VPFSTIRSARTFSEAGCHGEQVVVIFFLVVIEMCATTEIEGHRAVTKQEEEEGMICDRKHMKCVLWMAIRSKTHEVNRLKLNCTHPAAVFREHTCT